jgi:murein DD-endopeptidase MepM/ murein hydrolase activator NlpD
MPLPAHPRSALFTALLIALASIPSSAQSPAFTLTPAFVEAGSPELFRVAAPADATLEGQWQGHPLQFFQGRSASVWYALAGADVEAPAGPSTLKISMRLHDIKSELNSTIAVHPSRYRTTSITVEPKFVEPGPDEMKQIAADRALKDKVFAEELQSDRRLWSGSFLAPVKAAATDSFGTRRTFNGKLASVHKGTDFRAASGTPVQAGNSGIVVLAQPLYYEGNCVMIDHGMGLMSISMHLSRIDVKPGEQVTRGQQVGLSGATGRVTGPHLHWAIRWQNAYLDPAKLLRMNLNDLH